MKKLFAAVLSLVTVFNLALPSTAWAMAGTENYIIDRCDYENSTSNWVLLNDDSTTHDITTIDSEHGNSYRMVVSAGVSPTYSYEHKLDSFEHGEVTIEADFRYSTPESEIDFFTLINDVDAGTASDEFNPNVLKSGKINGRAITSNAWHHIKYVMNIEKKYYRTYIDNTLVKEGNNQSGMSSCRYIRTTLMPTGTTPLVFDIDNIVIKQTQDNISYTDRAVIDSVEFFTASDATYDTGATELTEDVFYANITMSKGVSGIALRNRAVKATVNGEPVDVYAYGSAISKLGYAYQYTWDDDYPTEFTVYFSEKPAKGSTVQIDLTDLYDKADYRVGEDCIIQATIEGDTPTDVSWSLEKKDGTVVNTTTQLSDGDEVCAKVNVVGGTATAEKSAILAIAAYDGEKMLDMVSTNVTILSGQQTLTSDYLTVAKSGDYKIKELLILKENVTPVTDANVVTDSYYEGDSEETEDEIKAEMTVNLPGNFTKYIDSGYSFEEYNLYDKNKGVTATLLQLDYDYAKNYFADTVCFVVDSNFFWGLDSKYEVKDKALWVDGEMYVSVETLNALFGTKTYTFARELNGKAYVPVKRAVEDVLNYNFTANDTGFAVISNRKFNFENEISRKIVQIMMRYIIKDMPLPSTLEAGIKDLPHPYLIPEDRLEDIKNKIENGDEELRVISDDIIYQADHPTYKMLNYEQMKEQGEPYSGMTSDDVLNYYWAYYKTGEEKYATKAIQDAMTMTTWTSYDADDFYLQTSNVISALAYTLDLFYGKLTTEQQNAIREAIVTKGLVPTYKYWYQSDFGWARRSTNWNTYCNTGVILGALAVRGDYAADTKTPFYYLAHAISSLEYQSLAYGPNGGWLEGLQYATMTVNKYVEALIALESVYDTDFSLSAVPGFLNYGNFPMYTGTNSGVVALGDSGARKTAVSPASSYMAYKTNNIEMQRLRLHKSMISFGKRSFQDLLWHMDDDGSNYTVDMPLDMNYTYTEIATARDNWGENATFMAAHAGANNDPHGHYDVGSFMYHSDGVVFADDTGAGNYDMEGYLDAGEDAARKDYYIARAEAHNVFVINPNETPGQLHNCETEVRTVASKPQGAIYTIDMTPAYLGQVRKAQRGFMLTEGRKVFVVQDEIKPKSNSDEYYWFWQTQATISIVSDNRIRLTKEGKSVDLYFESNVPFTLEWGVGGPLVTSPSISGQELGDMNRIIAKFTSSEDEVIFRVTAVPVGMNYTRGALGKMSGWTIEDGIRTDEYTLDGSAVTGVKYGITVEEFLSNIFVADSKKVTLNDTEVTSGTMKEDMKLVADGTTYDIEYIGSGATVVGCNILGYDENTSVDTMLSELAIVLGNGITASETEGNLFDGLTVETDKRTYTVRTSGSYVLNTITGVRDETPTALMLADLEPTIGKATATSEIVYNKMTVTADDGKIYTVYTEEPELLLDFEDFNGTLDFYTMPNGFYNSGTGFDLDYTGAMDDAGDAVISSEDCEERGGRALHITTDGTSSKDITFQLFKNIDKISNDAFMLEYWYKPETEGIYFYGMGHKAGNGRVPGSNYEVQIDTRFRDDGRIVAFNEHVVDFWEPNKWYHVKLKFNPVGDWRYTMEINGREVLRSHSADMLEQMSRVKMQLAVKAGVKASAWIDDIKLTRIYG